jgi:hypothetical protein
MMGALEWSARMMRPTDDTYVPGYLIEKAAIVVGAQRGAAFRVRATDDGAHTLELFRCVPANMADDVTCSQLADAMRRFVVPALVDGRDRVVEVPERHGPIFKCFVLVFVARDATGVQGVTAMEVNCPSRLEAKRRLAALKQIMA